MEERKLPCPACPPDCGRLCDTCKVFCKIYKEYTKEHRPPQPKVTVNDAYAQQKHEEMARKARHAKNR